VIKTLRFPLVIAVAAALAACGGSSYKGLTKAEFVKQANAICARGNAESEAVGKQLPKNATPKQIADLFAEKAIPLANKEFDDLAALKPPKEDRDTVKRIIAEARSATEALAKQLKDDPEKALSSTLDPYKKANDDAKAYGLTVCASSS
jgi:hypothetical protein